MGYRETCQYVVLCDRCGLTVPEATGWRTPAIADQAALAAGWSITRTEHLCPVCTKVDAGSEDGGVRTASASPMLAPATGSPRRHDVCWPPSQPSSDQAWERNR